MPTIPPLPYHEFPDLPLILDFLSRCEMDNQYMAARYQEQHGLQAAEAACRRLDIHSLPGGYAGRHGDGSQHLRVLWSDWHALSKHVFSMLAVELRRLSEAAGRAARIVRLQWDAVPSVDGALAASGSATCMILACHENDWRNEVASPASLREDHVSLMLKIGLQLLTAGDTSPLPDLCQALACVDKPLLKELQALLQTYRERIEMVVPGPDHFQQLLLHECMATYREWQPSGIPLPGMPRDNASHAVASPALTGSSTGQDSLIGDPPLHASNPAIPRDTLDILARPSAFERVKPVAHAVDQHATVRKRLADAGLGGDAKRSRIGWDGDYEAHAMNKGASEAQDQKTRPVRPLHVVFTTEAPPSWRLEQSLSGPAIPATARSAAAAADAGTRATFPAYRPPEPERGEDHRLSGTSLMETMQALVSTLSAPVQTGERNPRREALLASLVEAGNEATVSREAGSTIRVPHAQSHPAAPALAPPGVQIFNIPVFANKGPRL